MRGTRALIDLTRLERNFRGLQSAHDRQRLMVVLKANAYGHGMVEIGKFLHARGQRLFAVALIDEAVALRQAGITGRILVLGPPEAGRTAEYGTFGIEMTVPSLHHLHRERARLAEGRVAVHLKVDTGMGRIGFALSEMEALMALLKGTPRIEVRGVYSHLAEAENLDSDHSERQMEAFQAVRRTLLGLPWEQPPEFHLANSAGLLRDNRLHFDYARVGYALWAPLDFSPSHRQPALNRSLEPVMTLTCPLSMVKTTREGDTVGYSRTYRCQDGEVIATLPIGYGDGYSRALSNRGQVLIGDRRHPVVGNVSMDQTTVSLGLHATQVGDEAILLGGSHDSITVADMAGWAGTIGYEIFTRINTRIPRRYLYHGKEYNEGRPTDPEIPNL